MPLCGIESHVPALSPDQRYAKSQAIWRRANMAAPAPGRASCPPHTHTDDTGPDTAPVDLAANQITAAAMLVSSRNCPLVHQRACRATIAGSAIW
ncbi:hypothetical protein ACOMHN_051951 [Nucella lapillus]